MKSGKRSGGTRRVLLIGLACGAALAAGWALFRQPSQSPAESPKAVAQRDSQPVAQASRFEEFWDVVYIGDTRVGYGRTTAEYKQREGQEIVATDAELSLVMSRFGQEIKFKALTRTEETAAGDLLTFHFEMLNPPAAPTSRRGHVEGDRLIIESHVAGKATRSEIPWDGSLKSPNWPDRSLRITPLHSGETRTLRIFSAEFSGPDTITFTARNEETMRWLEYEPQKLLKIDVATSTLPGVDITAYVNARGEPQIRKTNLLGLGMAFYTVTREEALQKFSGQEADLAISTLVQVQPIDRPQQTRRVVYRVTAPGDDPARLLATGATQKMTAVGPNIVDLTVTTIEAATNPSGEITLPGEEFTAANEYIQSDDSLVQKHATQAAGDATDPWIVSQRLERWVYDNLTHKSFSTLLASAAEVARDLQGDCTEHAVLLAAMARARGIPARVAVGLVYVGRESSFAGHMWTEVFINGEWIPLDATLGQGGIAADHIKFADASFSAKDARNPLSAFLPLASVLGKLQIEVRDVEHR